ncbi:hypothetical protein BVX98_00955, partial [bacterium F11]
HNLIVKFKDGVTKRMKKNRALGRWARKTRFPLNSSSHQQKKGFIRKRNRFAFDQLAFVELSPKDNRDKVIKEIASHPDVAYVEPDYLISAFATFPNDPEFFALWSLHNTGNRTHPKGVDIDATSAWDVTTGDPSVIVAVVDTGIDYNHEDLAANMWKNSSEIEGDKNGDGFPGEKGIDDDGDGLIDEDSEGCGSNGIDGMGNPCKWTNDLVNDDDENGYPDDVYGYDFSTCDYHNTEGDCLLPKDWDSDPIDNSIHGTHVAGTIGAVGNNGIGITGVAWNVKLMAIKFLGREGKGSISDALHSIQYAIDHGAHIINNSWGGAEFSQALQDVINDAHQAGITVIAAAGNEHSDNLQYPAALDNVIAVGSTDPWDNLSIYPFEGGSNFGPWVDVSAPGSNIYSTLPNNGYGKRSGTSMASPHVAGVAALLKSHFPNISHEEMERRIKDGVRIHDREIIGNKVHAYWALVDRGTQSVGFSRQAEVVKEEDGFAEISVDRRGHQGAVSVRYQTHAGSALAEVDYLTSSGILSWKNGETGEKSILITLLNETIPDHLDQFEIRLTDPVGTTLYSDRLSVMIYDQDDGARFYEDEIKKWEHHGSISVDIHKHSFSGSSITVEVRTIDGTAKAGEDYQPVTRNLSWDPGAFQSKSVAVPLINDSHSEEDEYFYLTLSNPA